MPGFKSLPVHFRGACATSPIAPLGVAAAFCCRGRGARRWAISAPPSSPTRGSGWGTVWHNPTGDFRAVRWGRPGHAICSAGRYGTARRIRTWLRCAGGPGAGGPGVQHRRQLHHHPGIQLRPVVQHSRRLHDGRRRPRLRCVWTLSVRGHQCQGDCEVQSGRRRCLARVPNDRFLRRLPACAVCCVLPRWQVSRGQPVPRRGRRRRHGRRRRDGRRCRRQRGRCCRRRGRVDGSRSSLASTGQEPTRRLLPPVPRTLPLDRPQYGSESRAKAGPPP
jgi:hypothetical protein